MAVIGVTLSVRAAVSIEGIKADMKALSGLNMIAARLSPGVISDNNSSHLPPSGASKMAKPVTFLVHRFLGTDHLRWIHVIHDDLYPSL